MASRTLPRILVLLVLPLTTQAQSPEPSKTVQELVRVRDAVRGNRNFCCVRFFDGHRRSWLYAAARPRFGAGPRTAALTGVGYWVVGCALPAAGWGAIGLFPAELIATSTLAGLLEIVVASVVGAWPYKE